MKYFKFIILSFIILIALESTIRLTHIYKTYSEAYFGEYESSYKQKRLVNYYQSRKKTISYIHQEFKITCSVNSIGLRDEKEFIADTDSMHTLLFMGDSFTEGVGASCGNNMPEQFQKMVGDSILIYNGGVLASDPFFYLKWYEIDFYKIEPEEVIIVINNSDISDYIFRGGDERFNGGEFISTKTAPMLEFWYQKSHLIRFVLHFILRYDFTLLPPKEFEKESHIAIQEIANRINQWQNDHDKIKLHVVIHPYPASYVKTLAGHDTLPGISKYLDPEINFINLYPNFDEILTKENYQDYCWPIDGHFNDNGYKAFAVEIFNEWQKSQ